MIDLPYEPWKREALCAQTDPELFFPEKGGPTKLAKRICQACPVRAECLEVALERVEDGIWGGTSTKDRQQIRAARRAGEAPTCA